jgi:hypothetical protein
MTLRAGQFARSSVALLALGVLAACTPAQVDPTFEAPKGQYAAAFDAALETLRAYRFPIDRVDATAGVITTASKQSSGLASPWDIEQSTPTQEVEDLLALHSRRVRVSFEAATSGATTGENEFDAGPVRGRVEAFVDRRYVSGWRLSSAAILQSDFTTDTVAASCGRPQQFDAPLTRDERLEARLAARIRRTLSQPTADGVE